VGRQSVKILALHVRETKNLGDLWSCPLHYFKFSGFDVVFADVRNPPLDMRPDVVIYGGGSITTCLSMWDCPTIAWGVGHTERQRPWGEKMIAEHLRATALCKVYMPRDWMPGLERCVPCASCMHPAFDQALDIKPEHDVIRYSAARRVEVKEPADTPHRTNEDGSIEEALRFIASGRKVVTSSYHGAYWARLLGREVEVVSWGSKFDYVPELRLSEARTIQRYAYELTRATIS
jgi:hypothetical protein